MYERPLAVLSLLSFNNTICSYRKSIYNLYDFTDCGEINMLLRLSFLYCKLLVNFCDIKTRRGQKYLIRDERMCCNVVCDMKSICFFQLADTVVEFMGDPWLENKINSGIGLSYRPASPCSLAGRYDNLCRSWLIPPVRVYEFVYWSCNKQGDHTLPLADAFILATSGFMFMLASNGGGKQKRQKNRIRPARLDRPESGTVAKVLVRS
jgi:hypothetical protein